MRNSGFGLRASLGAALSVAALSFAVLATSPGTASARGQRAPWCSNTVVDGMQDCSYFSWEQCQATVSGQAGYCSLNQWVETGYEERAERRHRRSRRHY